MNLQVCPLYLNSFTNFWSIVKCETDQNGKHYTYKKTLFKAIQESAKAALPATMKTMSESAKNCIFDEIEQRVKSSVNVLFGLFVDEWYICVI